MSYIYSDASDGIISKAASSYTSARHATSGSVLNLSSCSDKGVFRAASTSGRASLTRHFTRSYFWFDTSGVTDCTGVSLELRGYTSTIDSGESVVVMKSDAFGGDGTAALASADFDNIVGWDGSSDMSGATKYSAAPAFNMNVWVTNNYNSIPLSSGAENDINNNNYIIVCCVSYKYDYLKADPVDTSGLGSGALTNNVGGCHSGATRRPRLNITHSASTNIAKVNAVALASIGKVNSVATANIGKINTVD
jgi:hypothetical protein